MELEARQIVKRLQEAGHIAYYAGGCVRDMLRGVEAKDFDIATSATPAETMTLFRRTVEVGVQFGVVRVMEGDLQFEVASFRSDGAYIDGRHPVGVTQASPEEDAQRRDFTVNGMFFDPLRAQVIDYVNGRADLERGLLRAIGDPVDRFREDRLRVLRAVRFATTLGFEIDPPTWQAVQTDASKIHAVSAERIREELMRLLGSPNRVRGFDLLDASGLLREVLPEVERLKGCEQPPQFHPEGDVFVHTRIMLGLLPPDAPAVLVLGVLLHDIGKPRTATVDPDGRIRFNGHESVGADMTLKVMERLRFSREETESVEMLVANHMAFKDVQQMRVAKLRRFMARPTFMEEMELHRVDCTSSHGMLDNYVFLRLKAEEFANEPLIPPPFVSGRDLIALGLRPGPRFGEILEHFQTLQLEGEIRSREEALLRLKVLPEISK